MITIFEKYISHYDLVEKEVSELKIQIEKLNKCICDFFSKKYNYKTNIIKNIEKVTRYKKLRTKGDYKIITDFSRNNKLLFSVEIHIGWDYNVLTYLTIKRLVGQEYLVGDIFYYFNTLDGLKPFYWKDFNAQKYKLQYEIIGNIDDLCNQITNSDFESIVATKKYNL